MHIPLARFLLALALSASPSCSLPSRPQPRDSNRGCQAASFSGVAWTASDLTYTETSSSASPHDRAPNHSATLSFNLNNPALVYPVACAGHSPDGFVTPATYPVVSAAPVSSTTDTSFSFNSRSGVLVINQTWICSDADPVYPTVLKGSSHAVLSLRCTETVATNTHWSAPEQYSHTRIACAPVNVTLIYDWMQAVA